MNEALLQAADSRTNEEEKNREVYSRPRIKKLVAKRTRAGSSTPHPDGVWSLS